MGGSQNKKTVDKKEFIIGNFCGRVNNQGTLNKDDDLNEIILSKTYTYPKGTYSEESTKFFNEKEKVLFYFSGGENVAAVRYLTIRGVHINILDQDRTSPLHISAKSGSIQLVEEIINQGANINIPDIVGWTALHIACYYKRSEVVLLLLKNGANLKTKNRDGLMPIDLVEGDQNCLDIINNFIMHSINNNYSSEQFSKLQKSHTNIPNDENNTFDYAEGENISYNIETNIDNYNSNNWSRSQTKNPKNPNLYKNKALNKRLYIPISKLSAVSHRSFINDTEGNNEDQADSEKMKEDQQKILDNYKVIPKKHKFYLNYKNSIRDSSTSANFDSLYASNKRAERKKSAGGEIPVSRSNNNTFLRGNTTNCQGGQNGNKNFSVFDTYNKSVKIHKFSKSNNSKVYKIQGINQAPVLNNNHNENSNSIVNAPKVFPQTTNLKQINEYFTNSADFNKNEYNSVNVMRHSHNLIKKDEYHLKYNYESNQTPFEFNLTQPYKREEDYEDNLVSHRYNDLEDEPEDKTYIKMMTNNYNYDNDSEKYKVYNSIITGSDDSFVIDTSLMKEAPQMSGRKGRNVGNIPKYDNRYISKTRNKSFMQKFETGFDRKNFSDLEEETVCMQPQDNEDDAEDSIIFSEQVATFKPVKFPVNLQHLNELVIFNNENDKKLFDKSETEYFLTKIKFSDIFYNIFKLEPVLIENMICNLFTVDPNFSLLFLLNILETENNCEKLINSLRKNVINKTMITEILTWRVGESSCTVDLKKRIANKFFDSFEYENMNFKESLKRCLKYFVINEENLVKLDQISQFFSKSFSKHLSKNPDKTYLQGEHSVYMMTFGLLATDLELRKESNKEIINKKFYDLMIILKNMNEGDNFDCSFIKDNFKFAKLIGFISYTESNKSFKPQIKKISMYKNGHYKNYKSIILPEGAIVLLKDDKSSLIINKFIYLKNNTFYNYKLDMANLSLTVEAKQMKKNLLLFKNKSSYIKYKKYSILSFKFETDEDFQEISILLKN